MNFTNGTDKHTDTQTHRHISSEIVELLLSQLKKLIKKQPVELPKMLVFSGPTLFLTAKVAVQQGLMKYVCLFVCLFVCVCVSTFEIHLLKAHQANQSTV